MMRRRRDLVLVAASGLARETAASVAAGARYKVVAVVDDDPQTWDAVVGDVPVVGGLDRLAAYEEALVVICVGKGSFRRRVVDRLGSLGVGESRFATVVDPRAVIGAGCTIGIGSILLPGVVLTANVRIGRHVVAMPNAVLTHDNVVHDYATVCAGVTLAGNVTVGPEAYLGAAAAVRERVTIGNGATVGLGSVVLRDVPSGETWVGVPAIRLRATASPVSSV